MPPHRRVYFLMSVVVVMWGGAFVAIKELLPHASVWTMVLLRFSLTTSGLYLAVWLTGAERRPTARADRRRMVLLGFCGVAAYHLALNAGERFVSANVASLIVVSMPVMVAVLAHFILHERMGATKIGGIALACIGVVVLIGRGTPGATFTIRSLGGAAVVLIAPLAWAVYTVVSKPLVTKYGPLVLSARALAIGTLMLLPFAIVPTVHDIPRLSAADWGWLVFLGLGCSAFAYAVWFYALERLEASQVAAWVYAVPLSALVWAAVLLGEKVTSWTALGGAMVIGGVVLIERVAPRVTAGTLEDAATAAREPA